MAEPNAAQREMGTGNADLRSSNADRGAEQRGPTSGGDKASDVLKEALRRADEAYVMEKDNITAGRDCQRFYAAKDYDQWDEKARSTRQADGRPILQINRLPQFVRQMTGDLRKAPPELKFLPAKDGASQEAAEALNGIKRNIDAQSNGKDCYIIATENAAIASQGAWRIVTEYEDDESFDLVIRKRPLRDPFGFLIDPFATEPDKSDMQYAFIYDNVSVEDFERDYPKFPIAEWPNSVDGSFPWKRGNMVRVAEYWTVEKTKSSRHLLADGTTTDTLPEGVKPLKSREIERVSVRYYIMSGKDILSGPHEWAGKYIPLCVVTGEEISMDGATYRKGMVHDARDVQRVYNYMRSTAVEAVALQPKAPFLGTVEHFKGHEKVWRQAGSKNLAFLTYNLDPKAPGSKPERAAPPIASQGLDTQSAIAASDMEAVIGIYRASLGAPSNETSGVAIARKQHEADTGTFLYPDNLARAIGYEGKILADLIPKIYDNERVVRILKEDGTADIQRINSPTPEPPEKDPQTGLPKPPKPRIVLEPGKYDVVVTTGPSFASKRAEASANMVELVRAVPGLAQVAGDLLIKNMDFPGADEIAKRLERMMPPGIKDDGPVQPPPPDPAAEAAAAKDAAAAHKTEAEAQGQEIQNVQLLMQMHATLQAVQAMLAGGAPPMPAGAPPPGGMPQAPPPAPEMPPMAEAPMDMGAAPPMAELPEGIAPV